MREILFRGKRIDNGEWITGGIFQQKADDVKDEVVYICLLYTSPSPRD